MNRFLYSAIFVLSLGFAVSNSSCTKKSKDQDAPPPATAPAPEPGNDVSETPPTEIPKIEGIEVTGEKFEPEGTAFLVEELKVADSTGKVFDQFPLLDWGPVKVLVENQTVRAFPNGDEFEIDYTVGADKKVVRTTKCKFTVPTPEQKKAYDDLFAQANDPNVNWETFYNSNLQEMASSGNKYAYDFFMNPDAAAKKFRKAHGAKVSFEPTLRALKFMKANGCSW